MIDFFDKYYCSIQNRNKLLTITRFYSFLRFGTRLIANFLLPVYFIFTRNKKEYYFVPNNSAGNRVIVSLTSYPSRINHLWLVIESILRQTRKPDRIVLYLSRLQFPDEKSLPKSLLKQCKRGLEIRFVNTDYRSHKKYLFALIDFPEDYLLTLDDDIFYRSTMIENLYNCSSLYPSTVIAQYCTQIQWDMEKQLLPYSSWTAIEEEKTAGFDIFFGSGGGVLFPPHSLHPDVVDWRLSSNLCPTADDVWLNAMCQLNNSKVKNIPGSSTFLPVMIWKDSTLSTINNEMNQNDIQIKKIREYYEECDPFRYHQN